LGGSLWVQQTVGVHTIFIRAIGKILKKPLRFGLSKEKVAILCGGPDWPTSVLTGIIKCNVFQMLIGTLPCIFLILPCVMAGASLLKEELRSWSPLIVMGVGASQGATLLMATVFIVKEMEASHEELCKELPEHEALRLQSVAVAKAQLSYKRYTAWSALSLWLRLLLLSTVAVLLLTCWLCFFTGSAFFSTFEIGGNVTAPIEDGGLNGTALNLLVAPGGHAVVGVYIGGFLPIILYTVLTNRHVRRRRSEEGDDDGQAAAEETATVDSKQVETVTGECKEVAVGQAAEAATVASKEVETATGESKEVAVS